MSKRALDKILTNLISNAIKYSYEDGEITIGTKNNYFFIENTCDPLDEQAIDSSFDLFSGSEDNSSNGLGLFVVKNILLNSAIPYGFKKSEKGMKFYFRIC
ncbi:Heme sensor protein hssS [Chlamydia trachomatis]|nr:Heme sensor protein hssS [Chlamydia trachomatis]